MLRPVMTWTRLTDAAPDSRMAPRGPGRLHPSDHLVRAAAAHVRKALSPNCAATELAQEMFGRDEPTQIILRAATAPASMTVSGWASDLAAQSLVDFLVGLAPLSAGAALMARGLRVSMQGFGAVTVPNVLVSATDAGGFVAEGAPIPVRALNISAGATFTPFKLAVITMYSRELARSSNIEDVVKQVLGEAVALSLDAAIFSTAAGSTIRPGGILQGVVPIAATASGTAQALSRDVANLVGALSAAGGGRDVVLVCAPQQTASLKVWAGPRFDIPILTSAALSAGTIVAVEAPSFASGFNPIPEFSASIEAVLHEENTTPLSIVDGSSTLAAPVRSLWQTDIVALRTLLRVAFAMRASGHVQVVNSVTW
jgi:hypothetical protein